MGRDGAEHGGPAQHGPPHGPEEGAAVQTQQPAEEHGNRHVLDFSFQSSIADSQRGAQMESEHVQSDSIHPHLRVSLQGK